MTKHPFEYAIVSATMKLISTGDLGQFNKDMSFLDSSKQTTKVNISVYNIVNGLFSGFPICCVMAFSLHNHNGVTARINYPELYELVPFEVQYVPCPMCLENKRFSYDVNRGRITEVNGIWIFSDAPD